MLTRRVFIKGVIGTAAVATVVPFEAIADSEVMYKVTRQSPRVFYIEQNRQHTLNLIRTKINKTLPMFMFEPNDKVTRNAVKTTISDMFDQLIKDNVVDDYVVVCDEQNNVPELVDSNRLVVDVAVALVGDPIFTHMQCRVGAGGFA